MSFSVDARPIRRRTPASRSRRSAAAPGRAAASPASPDLASRLRQLPRSLRVQFQNVEEYGALVRAANETLDPARVADLLVARMAQWLPLASWAVLVDEWVGQPRLLGSRGLAPVRIPLAQAIAARVFRLGNEWIAGNVAEELQKAPDVALIALPLVCRGETRAALVGLDRGPASTLPRLTPAGRSLLMRALEPLTYALDNAVRLQRAEALSVTDDLTQLYNSRFLSQVLRRETKRAARTRRPLSVLFVDLDGFKAVNDTWGHLSGSRVLVEAAGVLRISARETDVVARFGGDEFAVVLPDTGTDGARSVAERVRERMAAHRFLETEGLEVSLTASVGIATMPGGSGSPEALLAAADEAMYWIKEHGKNGIHVAPFTVREPRTGGKGRSIRR